MTIIIIYNNNGNNNKNKTKKKLNRLTQSKRGKKTHPIVLEIKQVKILKQIIMTPHPYPPTFLPRYPVLDPAEK